MVSGPRKQELREISPCATRRPQNGRRKKPGHCGRNDRVFLAVFPQRLRTGLTFDAPLALRRKAPATVRGRYMNQAKGVGARFRKRALHELEAERELTVTQSARMGHRRLVAFAWSG